MRYDNILTKEHGDGALRAGIIALHRPQRLNALNDALMDELGAFGTNCETLYTYLRPQQPDALPSNTVMCIATTKPSPPCLHIDCPLRRLFL
jgi:hypothetical protein